jgi:caa(3)-type oxidase subunit IV
MSAHAPTHGPGPGAHAGATPHGPHRNYVKIWGILVVLLVISVVGPMTGIRVVMLITAFGIALVKAYLVAKNFMHLDVEKPIIHWLLVVGLALMVLLYGALAPDIQKGEGQYWKKDANFHNTFTHEKPHGGDGHAEPAGGAPGHADPASTGTPAGPDSGTAEHGHP